MNSLKKIFDFYVFSNTHVALAGYCLAKITLFKFGFNSNLVPLLIGFSIIISYNFIRYFEIETKRLGWFKLWFFKNQIKLIWLSILAFVAALYIILFSEFNKTSLFIVIPFGFITLFYAIPLFKIGKIEISFRNFPGIKIFSIAIAWAGITVLFPLLEAKYPISYNAYFEFFQRILLLLAYTIPFDIRDISFDEQKLKTLPQIFGIKKVKILGSLLIMSFVLLGLLKNNCAKNDLFSDTIIALITLIFLWNSTSKQSRYYTSFFVEAIPILWFFVVLMLYN